MKNEKWTKEDLIRFRKKFHLTQKKLAQKLKVTSISVYRWENGIRGISNMVSSLLTRLKEELSVKKSSVVEPKNNEIIARGSEMTGVDIKEGDKLIYNMEESPRKGCYVLFLNDSDKVLFYCVRRAGKFFGKGQWNLESINGQQRDIDTRILARFKIYPITELERIFIDINNN